MYQKKTKEEYKTSQLSNLEKVKKYLQMYSEIVILDKHNLSTKIIQEIKTQFNDSKFIHIKKKLFQKFFIFKNSNLNIHGNFMLCFTNNAKDIQSYSYFDFAKKNDILNQNLILNKNDIKILNSNDFIKKFSTEFDTIINASGDYIINENSVITEFQEQLLKKLKIKTMKKRLNVLKIYETTEFQFINKQIA